MAARPPSTTRPTTDRLTPPEEERPGRLVSLLALLKPCLQRPDVRALATAHHAAGAVNADAPAVATGDRLVGQPVIVDRENPGVQFGGVLDDLDADARRVLVQRLGLGRVAASYPPGIRAIPDQRAGDPGCSKTRASAWRWEHSSAP